MEKNCLLVLLLLVTKLSCKEIIIYQRVKIKMCAPHLLLLLLLLLLLPSRRILTWGSSNQC
jgi:hypothetical protein